MAIALRFARRTDLGLGPKSRNEDSGYAGPHLLVLADGMGGHAAGDVASSLIVGQLAPLDGESIGAEQALPAPPRSASWRRWTARASAPSRRSRPSRSRSVRPTRACAEPWTTTRSCAGWAARTSLCSAAATSWA